MPSHSPKERNKVFRNVLYLFYHLMLSFYLLLDYLFCQLDVLGVVVINRGEVSCDYMGIYGGKCIHDTCRKMIEVS